MRYTDLCGEKVSTLGLGCMRLPTIGEGGPIDQEHARKVIEYAYENGVNYFDTAFRYHGGESETFVGSVLKQYPRDSFYLVSKLPGHMMKYENHQLGFQGYLSNFHCDSIADIFEEQLKKCGVDYFDFYHLHNVNENSWDFYTNEEVGVVKYLLEQKKAGRIKHLGFTSHGRVETIDAFLTKYEGVFELVQIQLNYLDWKIQKAKEKYEVINRHGLKVVIMESVRGGRLIQLPQESKKIFQAVNPEETMASWGYRFCKNLPGVAVTLSGSSSLEQIQENVEIFSKDTPFTEREKEAIDQVVDSLVNLVPCTGCRYCTEECPMGLEIPKLIAYYNDNKNDGATLSSNVDLSEESQQPDRCIGCGACAKICPQNIRIPDIMKELAEMIKK